MCCNSNNDDSVDVCLKIYTFNHDYCLEVSSYSNSKVIIVVWGLNLYIYNNSECGGVVVAEKWSLYNSDKSNDFG